ncbi:MAG: fused MFS/spermidine synthase [Gemmatales bacterium]
MNSGTLFAYFVTFTASFCMMVIELVAGRILAPYIGQHLYSWTSIIGVCLAGISIGAWLGGWLADRFPYRSTLGWFLFIAGLLSLAIPVLTDQVCNSEMLKGKVSLMLRIVIYTTMIFLPSTMVLGMISPMVIKLIIRDLNNTGSLVGRIYALSTIGSILGTFATGFFLIEEFGTRVLLYAVGTLLIVISPLAGGLFYKGTKYVGGTLAGFALAVILAGTLFPQGYADARDSLVKTIGHPMTVKLDDRFGKADTNLVNRQPGTAKTFLSKFFDFRHDDALYWRESNYFTLRISEYVESDHDGKQDRAMNYLILDNLVHSHADVKDPFYLTYEYLRIYDELVGWQLKRAGKTKHRELFVGGGGYTMQRYFHGLYKDCEIDVVEIDPYVTYLAENYMGAPKNDPRLRTKNEDGRLFVLDKQKTDDRYEYIFGDAFNDLSVPFHLTTVEFDKQLKNLLTPDGLVMSLVIDDVAKGLFLPSFLATMRQAFGEENVALVVIAKANGRQELVDYLKSKKLDQYIPELTKRTLEDVIGSWDATKYATEIAYLKENKVNDEAPYLKASNLDYFSGHDTVIVVGSAKPQNWDDFEKYLGELQKEYDDKDTGKKTHSNVVRAQELTEYLNSRTRDPGVLEKLLKGNKRVPWKPVVLTDDHAPVDNLLAPLFEKRFGYKKPMANKKQVSEDEDDLVKDLLKAVGDDEKKSDEKKTEKKEDAKPEKKKDEAKPATEAPKDVKTGK